MQFFFKVPVLVIIGGGRDGVQGVQTIKSKGGVVLIQNPKTAQGPELPQAVVDTGIANDVYEIEKLADQLLIQCLADNI